MIGPIELLLYKFEPPSKGGWKFRESKLILEIISELKHHIILLLILNFFCVISFIVTVIIYCYYVVMY